MLLAAAVALAATAPAGAHEDGPHDAHRLSMLVFDVENGATYDCNAAETLPPAGLQACTFLEPSAVVLADPSNPLGPSTMSNGPLGWEETIVYGDSITKTCGWYHAQMGHVSCSLVYGGVRSVRYTIIDYCGCPSSDADHATTGNVHNYAADGQAGRWATFIKNAQYGGEACTGAFGTRQREAGADGGVWSNDVPNAACNTKGVFSGTWGIGVNYQKTSSDGGVKSHHAYKWQYGG